MAHPRLAVFIGVGLLLFSIVDTASADTLKNLLNVYEEEVNMRTRYLAYSHKADEDGYPAVAALFRAVARGNQIHIVSFSDSIKKLGGEPSAKVHEFPVDTTRQNLDTAGRVEQVEWQRLCTEYIKEAQAENILEPVQTLIYAKTAKNQHANLFRSAQESPEEWKQNKGFLVCRMCGYSSAELPGRQCPSCYEVNSFDTIN